MKIEKKISSLESLIKNSKKELGEEVFLFVSRITPLINVDLLIKNEKKQTLLTWRNDTFCSTGWHIPGGIIRYKEEIADRINKVAKNELGAKVRFQKEPLAVKETMHPTRKNRGHFISLLYECKIISPPAKKLKYKKGIPKPGQWIWCNECPKNIIPVHKMYEEFINFKT